MRKDAVEHLESSPLGRKRGGRRGDLPAVSPRSVTPRKSWPSLATIRDAQRALLVTLPQVAEHVDVADRLCWACGFGAEYPLWRGAFRPTRAHIIARSAGGTLEPDNFLLLCDACHDDHPDGAARSEQVEWLRNRESWRARTARQSADGQSALLHEASRHADGEEILARWIGAHGAPSVGYPAFRRYAHEAESMAAGSRNWWPNLGIAQLRGFREYIAARRSCIALFFWHLQAVFWANAELSTVRPDNGAEVLRWRVVA